VEQRFFSGKEILQLVAPGLVVFFDTGAAVPPGQSLGFHDLKSDVGVGLRFGIARAPANNILRIDLAYAFNADPLGRRGFLVSFSTAQAFYRRRRTARFSRLRLRPRVERANIASRGERELLNVRRASPTEDASASRTARRFRLKARAVLKRCRLR